MRASALAVCFLSRCFSSRILSALLGPKMLRFLASFLDNYTNEELNEMSENVVKPGDPGRAREESPAALKGI